MPYRLDRLGRDCSLGHRDVSGFLHGWRRDGLVTSGAQERMFNWLALPQQPFAGHLHVTTGIMIVPVGGQRVSALGRPQGRQPEPRQCRMVVVHGMVVVVEEQQQKLLLCHFLE